MDNIPESELGTDFAALEARKSREVAEKDKSSKLPVLNKYAQAMIVF